MAVMNVSTIKELMKPIRTLLAASAVIGALALGGARLPFLAGTRRGLDEAET